tara:strand:- start:7290 stop:8432 length:1143 start_codon:yes stop_codon:yes gene_type:complete
MKKELKIVEYIREFGLDDAVATFKLKCKDYPHKVLLKYDQIESDMSLPEVQDCRGLILEKDTWKVMSLAFRKFFNSAETQAAKIDWATAHIFEKCDGSLIQLYWDWVAEKWCAGTSGMAEAEGEVNEKPNTTFSELFWDTIKKYPKFNENNLLHGFTYAFELMTPYNVVVCPHGESKVALLGVRDFRITGKMKEGNYALLGAMATELGVPVVQAYDMNMSNAGQLMATFEGMPFTEEGYVVCDANFNRIKLKNPAYVAAHHLKSKTNLYHIMTIVKSNEIEEYGATFPERREELNELKIGYDTLTVKLTEVWDELKQFKPKNITKQEQKKFAMKVFEVCNKYDVKSFTGLYFGLKDGKVESVKDFMFNLDDKRLYEILTK